MKVLEALWKSPDPLHPIKAFLREPTGSSLEHGIDFLRLAVRASCVSQRKFEKAIVGLGRGALNRLLRYSTIQRAQMAENSPEKKSPSKLEIDRPNDFKFHIAYGVYSRTWDENPSDTSRLKLNELISSLSTDENGYQDFYGQIQEYRRDQSSFRSGRTRIETQRKRDWQRADTRDGRNRRHR
jgi:hypothetical protein